MAARLDSQTIRAVFQSRPDIIAGIQQAADTPARVSLFNNIASFVHGQLAGEPAHKRRRVDDGPQTENGHSDGVSAPASITGTSADAAAAEPVLLEVKEISVSIPQRKKYDLCFTKNYLYARAAGTTVPVQGIVYAWRDIEYTFFLPVPEKTQPQHNYVLFPYNTCLPSSDKAAAASAGQVEPLVFTVTAGAPKPNTVLGPSASTASAVSDTYPSLLHWALTTHLRLGGNTAAQLVSADPKVFHSVVHQSQRSGERAVHVKAFRGSKDGYLFFLPTGILWGFKKPLLFMPLDRIVAISYTSVLQRTFNMVVEMDVSGTPAAAGAAPGENGSLTEEIEFGMLDQEDYRGIDETYVRRNGLQDRSMAERRKAKRELAENARDGKKGEDDEGTAVNGTGGDDGMTELEKAQLEAEQQIQDEEDDEEEDYDPGSEGESEGEGETSEEEGEDGEEGGEDEEMECEEDEEAEADEGGESLNAV